MESKFFGKNIYYFPRLNSTNLKAKELLENEDIEEGSAVICDEQFNGRGLGNNKWESSPGKNITVSYILKPHFLSPSRQFWLNRVVSLGVKYAVGHFLDQNGEVLIKWPNDIYWCDKKIAGILIENSIIDNTIQHCIVGIGLNVNQSEFGPDIPNPVSLLQAYGNPIEIEHCFKVLSWYIELWYNKLKSGDLVSISSDYTGYLYRRGVKHWYSSSGNCFEAIIDGVEDDGRIRLLMPGGGYLHYGFKEITYL